MVYNYPLLYNIINSNTPTQATKNTCVGSEESRGHEEASPHDASPAGDPQPRKKRKYVRRTTKEEQIENGTALWQFLMRKLEDQRCRGWIRWTGNDLEFKVRFFPRFLSDQNNKNTQLNKPNGAGSRLRKHSLHFYNHSKSRALY